MLEIPNEVKTLFMTDGIKKNLRISFPNGEHEDLTNKDIELKSFKFTESLCSQTQLKLGLCEASVLQFDAVGLPNIKGKKLKAACEIDCTSLGEEWCEENASTSPDVDFPFYSIPYGEFFVDSCPKDSRKVNGHRSITAYTKEAAEKWETPVGISSGGKMGWYTARSFSLPMVAMEKTANPAKCEGTPKAITTKRAVGVQIKYYTPSKKRKLSIFIKTYFLRATAPTLDAPSTAGTVKKEGLFYNKWSIGEGMTKFANKLIDDIKANIILAGYIPDNDSFETARKRLTQATIQRENVPDYSYGYVSDTTSGCTETYPWEPYQHLDLKEYIAVGASGENADYIYNEKQYTKVSSTETVYYYTSNSCARDVFSVPVGVLILSTNLREFWCPDYLEAKEYYFGGTLKTMFDTNLTGIKLNYSLNKTRTRTVAALINSEATTKKITEYYPEKPLTYDYKEVLQAQIELDGLIGKFNRFGGFEYISVNAGIGLYPREDLYPSEELYPSEPQITIPVRMYKDAEWEDQYCKPYDRVSVDYTNTDDQTVYAYIDLVDHSAEEYDPDDYQSYTLGFNYFIQNHKFTAAQIKAILQEVASNISNIKYMPAEVEMIGLPYIEAGDYVQFLTKESGFQTLVLRNTITGEHFLTQYIESR